MSRPHRGQVTLAVWGKELKESLRDSHALAYILGFPLLFYPLRMWGLLQFSQVRSGQDTTTPPRLEVRGPSDLADPLLEAPAVPRSGALEAGEIDALVALRPGDDQLGIEVQYQSTRARSQEARELVRDRLPQLETAWLHQQAEERGLEPPVLSPAPLREENLDPARRMLAYVVSLAMPGVLHLVMMLAALYPTVDVVVGERVRGTAETLLVSSTPRRAVVLGKLLAVLSLTVGAVVANGGAMGITLAHLLTLQGGSEALALGLSGRALALAGLVCLSAAGLVVGVMTLVVTPAHSFKEGQSAGNLVVTGGAVLVAVGMLPLTQLTAFTACLPLANSVLVLRSALLGDLDPLLALLALSELLLLTWLAFRLASRTLSRPDTLLA